MSLNKSKRLEHMYRSYDATIVEVRFPLDITILNTVYHAAKTAPD